MYGSIWLFIVSALLHPQPTANNINHLFYATGSYNYWFIIISP